VMSASPSAIHETAAVCAYNLNISAAVANIRADLLKAPHGYKWIHPKRKGCFALHGKSSGNANEILFSDATRLGDNIRAAGGTVEIEEWRDMWHVFQVFVAVMPESRRAIDKLADYIRDVLRL